MQNEIYEGKKICKGSGKNEQGSIQKCGNSNIWKLAIIISKFGTKLSKFGEFVYIWN